MIFLALWKAGEDLQVKELLKILESEKKLILRMSVIMLLGFSQDTSSIQVVVEKLEDSNKKIRAAAAWATIAQKSREAVPPIHRILLKECSYPEATPFVIALGNIKTTESQKALVDLMGLVLEDRPQDMILSYLIRAFQDVSGQNFMMAGVQTQKNFQEMARKAIEWWKNENK